MAGAIVQGQWTGLREAIDDLGVLSGEIHNVQTAALLDLAERASDHLQKEPRSNDGWPRDPKRTEGEHSADLWQVGSTDLGATLYNPAEYATYVHIQDDYGGPPGLAEREGEGPMLVIEGYAELYESEMDDFITRLLNKGST